MKTFVQLVEAEDFETADGVLEQLGKDLGLPPHESPELREDARGITRLVGRPQHLVNRILHDLVEHTFGETLLTINDIQRLVSRRRQPA